MAEKKSTLSSVVDTVKEAAVAVGHAADDHVIRPVGKALGLVKTPAVKGKATEKPVRKSAAKSALEEKQTPAARAMRKTLKSVRTSKAGNKSPGANKKGKAS